MGWENLLDSLFTQHNILKRQLYTMELLEDKLNPALQFVILLYLLFQKK